MKKYILLALTVLILGAFAWQIEDITNFTGVHIKSSLLGTATPQFMVWNQGSSNALEIRNTGGTPVFSVDKNGALSASQILTQGATINNLIVSQPTADTTATPAAVIDSSAAGSELLSVRKDATPVFVVGNNGAVTSTGAGTHSGGQTINNWTKVVAPTAIATATPAMVVDSAGVSVLLEVRDAATPVFKVSNGGAVTGYVLSSDVSGRKCVQGTQTITGTGTIAHGLSTPVAVQLSLAEDVTGDGARLSYTNSAATVTAKVWDSAATPAAAQAGHVIDYTICGTP